MPCYNQGYKYCNLGPHIAWETLAGGIFQEKELFLAPVVEFEKEPKLMRLEFGSELFTIQLIKLEQMSCFLCVLVSPPDS